MAYVSETVERLRRISSMVDIEFEKTINEAANLISELSLKLQNSQMERSSQYYNGGWIPCSERLPKEDGMYIVTQLTYSISNGKVINKSVEYVEFSDGKWRRNKHLKVIAWQQLPQLYKED